MSNRSLARRLSLEGQIEPEQPPLVIVIQAVNKDRKIVGIQRLHIGGGPVEPYIPIESERQRSIDEAARHQETR